MCNLAKDATEPRDEANIILLSKSDSLQILANEICPRNLFKNVY